MNVCVKKMEASWIQNEINLKGIQVNGTGKTKKDGSKRILKSDYHTALVNDFVRLENDRLNSLPTLQYVGEFTTFLTDSDCKLPGITSSKSPNGANASM